tara:strand:+ start:522 stop:626 length:105 start_codon:yes stop_codon:yes gene_type:complete
MISDVLIDLKFFAEYIKYKVDAVDETHQYYLKSN